MTHGDTSFNSGDGAPRRLRSPFLKGQQLAFCARCGGPLDGSSCGECGWAAASSRASNAGSSTGLIAGSILAVALVFGGLYGASRINIHNWYPDLPKAKEHMRLAHAQYESGHTDETFVECEAALQCAPRDGGLREEYANLLEKEGQPDQALEQSTMAAELCPNDQKILEHHAIMFDRLNNDDELRLAQYERVLKQFPKSQLALFWAARCCERLDKQEKARDYYERELKLDKSVDGTFAGIARTYTNSGDTPGAIAALRRGIKEIPDSAALHYELGLKLADDPKQKAVAIAELKKSIDLSPDTSEWTSAIISRLSSSHDGSFVMLPLEQVGDSFLVNVTINHKKRAKLIVDSGAEVSVISVGLANGLGLNLENAQTVQFASASGYGTAAQTTVDTIAVGRARQNNIVVDVCDLPENQTADGLLGMSFLKRYKFSIDASHKLLQLEPKD